MSHLKLVWNAGVTDPLISDSIVHPITSEGLEFGMAETARLLRIACGDLK